MFKLSVPYCDLDQIYKSQMCPDWQKLSKGRYLIMKDKKSRMTCESSTTKTPMLINFAFLKNRRNFFHVATKYRYSNGASV